MRDPLTLREPDAAVHARRTVSATGMFARVEKLTHDMREIVIRCDDGSAPVRAQAGQFVVVYVDGVEQPRPFSLARAPENEQPGEHTLLIRLIPGGAFSDWLASHDRVGAPVKITGPLGGFILDDSRVPMICIAGGSGLSAIRAIVEHACNVQAARDCYLFYGARTQRDLCLTAELGALEERWHPAHRFEFVPALSEEPEASAWRGARGLVTNVVARALLDGKLDLARARAYLCGPPPMVEAAVQLLTAAGMAGADILRDVFEDARSPAPVIDNRKCVLCDECLLVKPLPNCIVEAAELEFDAHGVVTSFTPVSPARSSGLYYNSLVIDETVCIRCNACVAACPHGAISPSYSRRTVTLRQGRADPH